MKILVTGAGGFIGGHLVGRLLRQGHDVRAADIKPRPDWYQWWSDAENWPDQDLALGRVCQRMCRDQEAVYNLAADMGGMGFISGHKAECMLSVLVSTHMLVAARDCGARRFFYSSSACVYPGFLQESEKVSLKEDDAYPADPEDGYGWEKLFSERMARHFHEDYGLEVAIARYHNCYGPHGTYEGGREKAPAAVCRKVIEAVRDDTGTIEIWGDGEQTRSFMYIDDCLDGTQRLMASAYPHPLNVGSNELVSINELVTLAESFAGVRLERQYDLSAPQGVRGRNSDNTLTRSVLGWEPETSLAQGLATTYAWIQDQIDGTATE